MPRCAFYTCENCTEPANRGADITFHKIPTFDYLRSKWVKEVQNDRKDDLWMPARNTVVCSQHFKPSELYTTKNGIQQVCTGAVPQKNPRMTLFEMEEKFMDMDNRVSADVPLDALNKDPVNNIEKTVDTFGVCRCCLVSGVKLLPLNATLRKQYQTVTSTVVSCDDGKPQHLCWECAHRVAGHAAFASRCLSAETLLSRLHLECGQINSGSVSSTDRLVHGLCSRLGFSDITLTVSTTETKREHLNESREHPEELVKLEYSGFLTDSEDLADVDMRSVKPEKPEDTASLSDDCDRLEHSISSDDDEVYSPPIVASVANTQKKSPTASSRHTSSVIVARESDANKSKLSNACNAERNAKKKAQSKARFEDFARLIVLSLEEQKAELRKRINSMNYKMSPHTCDHCFKGFIDSSTFKNHMARHDEANGDYACRVCAIRYDNRRAVRSHEHRIHSHRYQCKACPHRSPTFDVALRHQNTVHLGQVPTYLCNLCGKTFHKKTSYLSHVRILHPSDFVCLACGDSFIGQHGLYMHRLKMHKLPSERAGCATPPQERHCTECNLQFDNVEAFRKHNINSLKHTAGLNICRACGAKFSDASALTEHRLLHRKENENSPKHYECSECSRTFRTGRSLASHVPRAHFGVVYEKKNSGPSVICEQCGKSFKCQALLRYHKTKHTGERPFACKDCPKRFGDPAQLYLHRRSHTKEQPYRCSLCSKRFSMKGNLNRHMTIHNGEKPFECIECGRRFNQNAALKAHVDAVHLGLPPRPRKKRNRVKREKQPPRVQSE